MFSLFLNCHNSEQSIWKIRNAVRRSMQLKLPQAQQGFWRFANDWCVNFAGIVSCIGWLV